MIQNMSDSSSTCLMHSVSYATPIRNEAMHSSISFGRFMTESLSWEKWSTFSHNRYVEEAASYAQPGSVAQKKAFFEAHYKRVAARNAAALLEANHDVEDNNDIETTLVENGSEVHEEEKESETTEEKENKAPDQEDAFTKSSHKAEDMRKPLFKSSFSFSQQVSSKKKLCFSSAKSVMTLKKASEVAHLAAKHVDLKKGKQNVTPKVNKNVSNGREGESLGKLLKLGSTKEADPTMQKTKACPTPLRTPTHQATKIGMPKKTPCSENRSNSTSVDPSVSGSKTPGKNWHILSAVSKSLTACKNKLRSPTMSTPFLLRTEQRAARRKQKLEEKFDSKADEKVQLQTKLKEKADNEIRKFRRSFCFKARPLPDFYKENKSIRSQTDQVSKVVEKV